MAAYTTKKRQQQVEKAIEVARDSRAKLMTTKTSVAIVSQIITVAAC